MKNITINKEVLQALLKEDAFRLAKLLQEKKISLEKLNQIYRDYNFYKSDIIRELIYKLERNKENWEAYFDKLKKGTGVQVVNLPDAFSMSKVKMRDFEVNLFLKKESEYYLYKIKKSDTTYTSRDELAMFYSGKIISMNPVSIVNTQDIFEFLEEIK